MTIPHTARYRVVAASAVAAMTLAGGGLLTACNSSDSTTSNTATSAQMPHSATAETAQTKLYTAMRTLWGQHMEWTWSTVVAFAAGSPGLQPTMDRLLQDQVDTANALAPYYGEAAAKQLADLLTTHIKLAVPVLTAAKNGDKPALDKAVADWHANAQEIADFLAKANPTNWPQATMREAMSMHIDETVAYAAAVIGGNWADAITKYDKAEAHMMDVADILSQGVIAQFPNKF